MLYYFPVYNWFSFLIYICVCVDAFKMWYWRRILKVPWIARRSNQTILRDNISPEYSLEGLMPKLSSSIFGHLMWTANSLEKSLMLGKMEGRRRRHQRMRRLDGINNAMDMKLGKFQEMVRDREAWHAAVHGSQRVQHNRETEKQQQTYVCIHTRISVCVCVYIYIYVCIHLYIYSYSDSFHYRLLQGTEYSSLCYVVGCCCLSTEWVFLNILNKIKRKILLSFLRKSAGCTLLLFPPPHSTVPGPVASSSQRLAPAHPRFLGLWPAVVKPAAEGGGGSVGSKEGRENKFSMSCWKRATGVESNNLRNQHKKKKMFLLHVFK